MEPAKERSGHDGGGVKEELNRYESNGFEEGFNEKLATAIDQVELSSSFFFFMFPGDL